MISPDFVVSLIQCENSQMQIKPFIYFFFSYVSITSLARCSEEIYINLCIQYFRLIYFTPALLFNANISVQVVKHFVWHINLDATLFMLAIIYECNTFDKWYMYNIAFEDYVLCDNSSQHADLIVVLTILIEIKMFIQTKHLSNLLLNDR